MKTWARLTAAGAAAAGVPALMMMVGVLACGPDFEPEVFVPANHPENPKVYSEGHLGVLQPTYYHAELVVAYRYLSGGHLSPAEKAVYNPPPPTQDQLNAPYNPNPVSSAGAIWLNARMAAVDVAPAPDTKDFAQNRVIEVPRTGYVERNDQLNCPDAAFTTAAQTLQTRSKSWGASSPALAEWLHGQDAVFSNCAKPGQMPAAPQPNWSAALKQDRAYQIAAAKFYALNFDGAVHDFTAIAQDKASPWSRWGEYLAARAEVRKAANNGKAADYGEMASFDPELMKAAETRLLRLQAETKDPEIRHAAAAELGFIDVRLAPGKRLDQVSLALAGTQPDPEFTGDLADLDFLMDRKVTGDSDLVHWIEAVQNLPPAAPPAKDAPAAAPKPTALSVWQAHRTAPWLVAAIADSRPSDATAPDLIAAAAQLKPDSPAYVTANYHRIRLLLDTGKPAEARTLADTVLAGLGPDAMASTRNGLLGQRMRTARTLSEFLADAPRTIIDSESSAADLAKCAGGQSNPATGCTGKIAPMQFDQDAADTLNTQIPLSVLEQAATNPVLPKHLREAIASAAWIRALGLSDTTSSKQMAQLLPAPLRQTAGDSDGFPATLALLRSPGLRPYLQQGVQRSASYAELDHFRDNWWCGRWTDGSALPGSQSYGTPPPTAVSPVEFVTPQQRKQADEEAARMNALPPGIVWIGQRAMEYVKAHPDDKNGAEALALIVRGTRYGCSAYDKPNPQQAISKQAFEMLHKMYPKSEWAMKTKYYY